MDNTTKLEALARQWESIASELEKDFREQTLTVQQIRSREIQLCRHHAKQLLALIEPGMNRMINPKEGDKFKHGARSVRVTAVADGIVHYEITHENEEPLRKWEYLETYARLARRTVENGAVFEPAT